MRMELLTACLQRLVPSDNGRRYAYILADFTKGGSIDGVGANWKTRGRDAEGVEGRGYPRPHWKRRIRTGLCPVPRKCLFLHLKIACCNELNCMQLYIYLYRPIVSSKVTEYSVYLASGISTTIVHWNLGDIHWGSILNAHAVYPAMNWT
jgi:hypothetical protein